MTASGIGSSSRIGVFTMIIQSHPGHPSVQKEEGRLVEPLMKSSIVPKDGFVYSKYPISSDYRPKSS